ncbi:MAG: tetratricopeptide repeat protein [Candidatus Hermodarchaeota archaeon]
MFGSKSKELIRAEKLLEEGKFDEANVIIDKFEKTENITPTDRLACQLFKNSLLHKQGNFEEALTLAEQILQDSQNLGLTFQQIDAILAKIRSLFSLGRFEESLEMTMQGEQVLQTVSEEQFTDLKLKKASLISFRGLAYQYKGELDKALEYHQQSLALRREVGKKEEIAASLNNIGIIYWQKGELNQALEHYQQCLVIFKELGNTQHIAASLTNIGTIYYHQGDLNQALKYYYESLELLKKLNDRQNIARTLNNIALVHDLKGNLDQALECNKQSLVIFKELGNKYNIAVSLNNIGKIYWQKDDIIQALNYYQQSLIIRLEIGNKLDTSHTLFHLVSVAIERKSFGEARQYLDHLQQINEEEKNKITKQRYSLACGLILKTTDRLIDIAEAQKLFQEIAEDEVVEHELTVIAMLHLCDLLLIEFRMSGQESVLQEVKTVVQRLLNIAKQQHSYWLLTETYILQSRLALLELDLQNAQKLLEQAQLTAEEKGLTQVLIKVLSEQHELRAKLATWEQLLERDSSLNERLELAELENLLTRMARRKLTITERETEKYAQEAQRLVEAWQTQE